MKLGLSVMEPPSKKQKLDVANTLIQSIPPPPDYEPLPYRDLQRAGTPNLPPDLPPHASSDPYSLFTLFFTESHFETIARNTNQYAKARQAGKPGKRAWWPTSAAEVKVFIGIFVYMGVVRLPAYEDYWSTELGHFLCTEHMSLNRFEDMKRFLHISRPTAAQGLNEEEDSEDEAPEQSTHWWYKLEPLASELRSACSKLWSPGSNLSVDEMMIRCFGRSTHTVKAPNKPIKQGYRIYALCEAGYLYYFMWSSKTKSYGELKREAGLSPTESMVLQMAQTLPKQQPHVIYMDNLFTRVPLLRQLRQLQIGACGTTRKHPEFPQLLLQLKEHCSKRMEWNTTAAIVARKQLQIKQEDGKDVTQEDSKDPGVLCFAWQDNNTVIACSTVHRTGEEHTITRKRRRPQITSTNGSLVRKVFGDDVRKNLPIPLFIDDYNHFMGGVDIADQLRSYYTTQRISLRNWYPLFFWIIDTAILNSYLIGKSVNGSRFMSHKEFRVALWTRLFSYSKLVWVEARRAKAIIPGASSSRQAKHERVALATRSRCVNCRLVYNTSKGKAGDVTTANLSVKRSVFGCSSCNVALCTIGSCWDDYHQIQDRLN